MLLSMRWQVITVVAVLAALLLWFVVGGQSLAVAKSSQLNLAQQAHRLTDVRATEPAALDTNQPTLIKLWASWCPLCLSELGQTEEWVTDPDFSGVNLLTVVSPGVLGEQPLAEFKDWYSGLNYPQLPVRMDSSGELVKRLGVKVYPSWALLDQRGQLARVIKAVSINLKRWLCSTIQMPT